MKNATLLFALLLASTAQAGTVLEVELTRIQMDPALRLGPNVGPGNVELDLSARNVRIELHQPANCPRGFFCVQMMQAPVVFEAPLADRLLDDCNVQVYEAVADRNYSRGWREIIQVKDYTQTTCDNPDNTQVEVVYMTEHAETGQRTVSRMSTSEPLRRRI